MANILKQNTPLLVDSATGRAVGVKNADGSETLFGGAGFTKNVTTGLAETTVGAETFAALPVAGGNVSAKVNHRTGTLSSLKTLVGGNGEIAVATDQNALVVYDGVSTGGETFFPGNVGAVYAEYITETPATNAVQFEVMSLASGADSDSGIVLSADGTFTLVDGYKWLSFSGRAACDPEAGTVRSLKVQAREQLIDPWTTMYLIDIPGTASEVQFNYPASASELLGWRYFRVVFGTSSASETFAVCKGLLQVGF